MTTIDWGAVAALVIGVGGLLLAGYQARLSSLERAAERAAAFRKALYDQQVAASLAVAQALNAFMGVALTAYTTEQMAQPRLLPHRPLDDAARERLRSMLAPSAFVSLQDTWRQWWLVLPKSVNDTLAGLSTVFFATTAPAAVAGQYAADLVYSTDPAMPLSKASQAVYNALREGLGVEALSEQTQRAINGRRPGPS